MIHSDVYIVSLAKGVCATVIRYIFERVQVIIGVVNKRECARDYDYNV